MGNNCNNGGGWGRFWITMKEWVDRGWEFADHHFVTLSLMSMFLIVWISLIHFAHDMDSKAYEVAADICKGIMGALLLALRAGGNGATSAPPSSPTLVPAPNPNPNPTPTPVVTGDLHITAPAAPVTPAAIPEPKGD